LTGGEPMLQSRTVIETAIAIREESSPKIYMYTALASKLSSIVVVLLYIDGITLTLHEQSDVESFVKFNDFAIPRDWYKEKSLRLNIFKGVDIGDTDTSMWKVKRNMQWIRDCPLPKDEVFMRL
jgi:hypothetical protein